MQRKQKLKKADLIVCACAITVPVVAGGAEAVCSTCEKGFYGPLMFVQFLIILSLLGYIYYRKRRSRKLMIIQEQRNQARKMEAVGQLARGVAHDFNNLLGSINGLAEVLDLTADQEDHRFIEMILSITDRASQLTDKLQTLGRTRHEKLEPVDMHEVVNNAADILKISLGKRIEINLNLNAEKAVIMGDESQLLNALLNLGINAGHAMPDGGQLGLESSIEELNKQQGKETGFKLPSGRYICIRVRDNGAGIPKENISKIFEPLFTTRKNGKGSGLGLSSVYGTIVSHHGGINVRSELAIGTVFTMYLPLSDKTVAEHETLNETAVSGLGQLILVVDDEQVVRNTMSKMLTSMNYEVITASNGKDAVDMFSMRAKEISLIIMDVVMPEMSGRKAFEHFREIDSNIKVIFTSGFMGDEALGELARSRNTAFLKKPFRKIDLGSNVASMLKG